MSDEIDKASILELEDNERALQNHFKSVEGPPMFDLNGEKICKDCGDGIVPPARAQLLFVVRCLACQSQYDLRVH